jgi:hypothetical protein
MPADLPLIPFICKRCLRANRRIGPLPANWPIRPKSSVRTFTVSAIRLGDRNIEDGSPGTIKEGEEQEKDEGAMTRRLRDMSEQALETGGRSSQKAVSEAGFSEDLKKQLEERIASANFRAEHRASFLEAELPSHVGRHIRDIATADPWTGEESIHDASLRMLNDAHKPLRFKGGSRAGGPSVPLPRSIDTGKRTSGGAGTRLESARDRSWLYSSLKDSDVDAKESETRFQELKDRFSSHARSVVPGTIQGLASLANERIEDAISRGQFKNLPRGKVIERDYNASNPFLDTTEYFMNKMIQKQDIVPPWIEKQQELASAATKFRSRLRSDWRRHAARVIASKGGTLQEQMRRAEAYAKAELIANPQRKKQEVLNTVDGSGHISQISLSGELRVPDPSGSAPVMEEVRVEETSLGPLTTDAEPNTPGPDAARSVGVPIHSAGTAAAPAPQPFRDPAWEAIEASYHTAAINDLNSKTRSYNLQAPDLAKKPYFSLARELNACYADVAPQLAAAIKERASAPRKTEGFGSNLANGPSNGVLDKLVGEKAKVRDERVEKQYGFRQFWKDVWG